MTNSLSQNLAPHDATERFNTLNPFLGDEQSVTEFNPSRRCGAVQHIESIPGRRRFLPIFPHHNFVLDLAVLTRDVGLPSPILTHRPLFSLRASAEEIVLQQAPEEDGVEEGHEDQHDAQGKGVRGGAAVKVMIEPDPQQAQRNAAEEEERDEVQNHHDAVEPVGEGHPKHLQQLPAVEQGGVDLHHEGQDVGDDGDVEQQAVADDDEHLGKMKHRQSIRGHVHRPHPTPP